MPAIAEVFKELILDRRRFVETLLVVENKQRQVVPFVYNPIQADANATQTGHDIWVKPSSVGFSTERIADKLVDTLTAPGTNTVLVAYEDFITSRLLGKVNFFYNHLANLGIPNFPAIHHDCLPYHTKIRLADGSFEQIGQLVNGRKQANVLTCNLTSGDVEAKPITNWFKYPSNHLWTVLGSSLGYSHMMTHNHQVFVGGDWKMAGNVELGETTYHYGFVPNDDQKQLILGSILGDAHIDTRPGKGGIYFGQSNIDYARFKHSILAGESSELKSVKNNGYSGGTIHTFRLSSSPWYGQYNIDDLDCKGLAIWYCDDGNYNSSNGAVCLHTECFSLEVQQSMKRLFESKFGILSEIRQRRNENGNYNYLVITNPRHSDNHKKFFELIAPYIPDCMDYKVPSYYRCHRKHIWSCRFQYGLVPYEIGVKDNVLTVECIYNYEYSIEVADNHNFFTSAGLVKNSDFQKTFKFYVDGRQIGVSSIYIASARSRTAGRAEVIHHLLLDEHAFYIPEATERIIAPAMARLPPDGTVDSFSTPNGEDNDFHDWYVDAKNGNSIFTAHFYPWFLHPEYSISLNDSRITVIPETDRPEFNLTTEEEILVFNRGLTFSQIRWRRWMNKVMDSLRRKGEIRTLFKQEFPEDDVSCFLATGDMYFDVQAMDRIAKQCYEAPTSISNLLIWYPPEKDRRYTIAIDPGQARVSQTAITVLTFVKDEYGNYKPRYCARDAGLYAPEITVVKAIAASNLYNKAEIAWEANSHGLAITELLKHRRPIYMRKNIVSGVQTSEPGWLTTSTNKDYMLQQVNKALYDLDCHDIEFVRQCRNHRLVGDKVSVIGPNDVFMSFAVGLVCSNPKPFKVGYVGRHGWKW